MTDPVFFCYGSIANVEAYAAPGAIFVTGRTNCNDAAFQVAREKGAEVYRYLDPIEVPDSTSGPDLEFYLGDVSRVPHWGGGRINFGNHLMVDLRVGSAWSDHVVEYVARMMQEDKFDGVFLDCVGSRLWSTLAKWESWPAAEQREWATGNVDLVRRLHSKRIDGFVILNNNLWHLNPEGERYVNGVCLELPTRRLSAFHRAYAGRQFGVPEKRLMIVVARPASTSGPGEGALWAEVPGVTHIAETTVYKAATPSVVPYEPAVRVKAMRLEQQLADAQSGGTLAEQLRAELAESRETSRRLGDRVDLLTTKVQRMAEFNAKEAEGVE